MPNKLPINLADLLRQRTVEGERIEYKAGWNPDATLRTVCAFANDFGNLGGGYVVIGQDADANGQPVFPPVGLAENQLDKIQQELLAACQLIQPPYFPLLSLEVIEGRNLIVLQAPGGTNRPYKAPSCVSAKHKNWHYYVRRYSSTVEAKGEIEQELLSLTANVPWDDRLAQQAKVSDLSHSMMLAYLNEADSALAEDGTALSVEELGRQMNVVGGPSECPCPKNVGLLLFNETPYQYFPYTQIDVVWFPEGAGGDRFDEKTFRGPLARMTREALGYVQRNYLHETVVKHPQRAEATRVWNFPYAAVEEALVNAVYHRSYEEREPIEVRISHDEMAILSFPGPDRSIRLADFKAGRVISRRYRNRRIGEFLKELELTEGRSTGVPKIMKAMAINGSPAPRFETDEDRSAYVIHLPSHPLSKFPDQAAIGVTGKVEHITGEVTGEVEDITGEVTGEVEDITGEVEDITGEVTGEVEDITGEVALLLHALDGEMTRQQIQDRLALKHEDYFRSTYLLPALATGLMEMTQPDKPRSSKQRYRLTAEGKRWVQQHVDSGFP